MTGPRVSPDDALVRRIAALRRAGATDDEVAQIVEEHDTGTHPDFSGVQAGSSTTAGPESRTFGEKAASAVHGLSQGLTLGYGDEIIAGVNTAAHAPLATASMLASRGTDPSANAAFGREYEPRVTALRERGKLLNERNPKTALASELAGGLAPILATGGASAAESAPSLLRTAGRAGAQGAKYGAIAGYGSAEGDQSSQIRSAAAGAGAGLLLGAGAPIAGRAAGTAAKALGATALRTGEAMGIDAARQLAESRAGQTAKRLVAADITAAGKTPASVKAEAATTPAPARLADLLGDAGGRRLRGAAAIGGDASTQIENEMGERALGRTQRVGNALEGRSGVPRTNLVDLAKSTAAERRAHAEQLYGEAFGNAPEAINDPRVFDLLEHTPSFRQAWDYAQRIAAEKGEALPTLFDQATEGKVTAPSPKSLHYLKLALDDMIERAPMSDPLATGTGKTLGAAQSANRAKLLGLMDELIPGYGTARATFRSESELLKAIEQGAQAPGKHPDVIGSEIAALGNDEAKKMYRLAMVNELGRDVRQTGAGKNAATRVFKGNERLGASPDVADQLRHAFANDAEYKAFLADMVREGRMAKTEAMALSGSRTTPLAKDVEGIENAAGGLLENVAKHGPIKGTARTVAQQVANRAVARTPKTADALAGQLLQPVGAPTLAAYLDELGLLTGSAAKKSSRSNTLARALGAYSGMAIGK